MGMDGAETAVTTSGVRARLPAPLRRVIDWANERWLGRLVLEGMSEARRIELFDRSMTIAAQIFSSILPILIALASWFGRSSTDVVSNAIAVPPETQSAIEAVLATSGDATFGVLGVLVILLSATSLSRALTRACAAVWELPRPVAGLSAMWRWVAVVLALALSLVATRQLHLVSERIPPRGFWDLFSAAGADVAVALFIPLILLAGAIPVRRLLPGAVIFGLAMGMVRPAASIYLPRVLDSSAERYGSIGVAFTYLTFLYLAAFCFLAAAVLGQVVVNDEGRLGGWIRRETGTTATPGDSPDASQAR
jgi:membrane protein